MYLLESVSQLLGSGKVVKGKLPATCRVVIVTETVPATTYKLNGAVSFVIASVDK